jgi:thiamine kinase-like enzyme
MNNEQCSKICIAWDLGHPLSLPVKVHGGLLHRMWRVDTDKASYAVKQLSKNIHLTEIVRGEYELSEKLASEFAKHGIQAISAIPKAKKYLVDIDDATFIIYPWVDAKTLNKEEVSALHAIKIAKLLADIHRLNLFAPEIKIVTYDVHTDDEIINLIEHSIALSLPFSQALKTARSVLLNVNKQYQQAIPSLTRCSVVTHSDVDQKNVLWDANCNPILIDWESVRLLNPTYELFIAALDWSGITTGVFNVEVFDAMLTAYQDAGGVVDRTMVNMHFCGIPGHCISWLVYNIRRSLNTNNVYEEQTLAIEQVNQTLNMILYLDSKRHELKTRANSIMDRR